MDILDNGRKVIRIVITGGPCGGKTTSMKYLLDELNKEEYRKDYVVLVMPETATQLISGGIAPWTCETPYSYQVLQMKLQLCKEEVYAVAAEEISRKEDKSVIILYDRGWMDNKAYVSEQDFIRIMEELNLSETECLSWYDVVFHLTSAAKGAETFYTCDNNNTMTETLEEAAAMDDRSLLAWEDHPCQFVFDNSGDFQDKLDRLLSALRHFLREEVPAV